MIEATYNEHGKLAYSGVTEETPFNAKLFNVVPPYEEYDDCIQYAFHSNLGSLTVLYSGIGYSGSPRDTETGYRDPEGKFWLASGMFDICEHNCKTVGEAIAHVKARANNCIGD